MIQCPYFLSTISPSMHAMIYVLIYSETSKGLSLGELIRAFYIIIFIPYIILLECYLHCYVDVLHVLDDLWDFHKKSLFLAFNIWEAKYTPFIVFIVSRVSRTQIIKGKIPRQVFIRRRVEERRPKTGGPNGVGPRDPPSGPSSTSSRGAFYQHLRLRRKGTP